MSATKKALPLEKIRNPKILIPLIIVVLLVAVAYFKGLIFAATVNGQPITRLELILELEKRNGRETLSSLVSEKLILQEARKQNVSISEKEIDTIVKQTEDNLSKQGQSLEQALSLQGLTKEDFIKQITVQQLVDKILVKTVKVKEEEIDKYLEDNKNSLPSDMKPEELRANVKKQLEQQELYASFQTWLQDLQNKAKINYFIGF